MPNENLKIYIEFIVLQCYNIVNLVIALTAYYSYDMIMILKRLFSAEVFLIALQHLNKWIRVSTNTGRFPREG